MSEIDLLLQAIEEGKLALKDNEIIIVHSDDHVSKYWGDIAKVLTDKFPGILVIMLPKAATLETVEKDDAIKILNAIINHK
jgi:hypothetical protein